MWWCLYRLVRQSDYLLFFGVCLCVRGDGVCALSCLFLSFFSSSSVLFHSNVSHIDTNGQMTKWGNHQAQHPPSHRFASKWNNLYADHILIWQLLIHSLFAFNLMMATTMMTKTKTELVQFSVFSFVYCHVFRFTQFMNTFVDAIWLKSTARHYSITETLS